MSDMNDNQRILTLFTRTPLHVGAGSSVGAIDQPVIRERHTGFPVIPASSLKGTFADAWNDSLFTEAADEKNDDAAKGKKRVRVTTKGEAGDAAWLFGSDSDKHAAAGALSFSEGRLLAFPIRSAKGCFAWITCPLILARAARDGVLPITGFPQIKDEQAIFQQNGPLALGEKIVLEEYTFTRTGGDQAAALGSLGESLAALLSDDPVWKEIASRLVILSDGMMGFFARTACEVAQHVRIDDETGTAAGGALFNQENVPSETMFYSLLHATGGRGEKFKDKKSGDALEAFGEQIKKARNVFQFGGDASTGLGFCTAQLAGTPNPS